MAGAFEQTIIVGNVGRTPELRYTQSGIPVCDFSVAVTIRYGTGNDGNREQREKTNWYRVTTWRGLAEVCSKYVKKGMSVMVTGSVEANAFMGQDGQPRASLDLTAREVQFLNRVDESGAESGSYGNSGGGRNYGGNSGGGNNYDNFGPPPSDVDDIPF